MKLAGTLLYVCTRTVPLHAENLTFNETRLDNCPAHIPGEGTTCVGELACDYNWNRCPGAEGGAGDYQDTAHCIKGKWAVGHAAITCSDSGSRSETLVCPPDIPKKGNDCSGKITCDYNWHACPGDDKAGDYTDSAHCMKGNWKLGHAEVTCPDTECPVKRPLRGQTCSGKINCDYNWKECHDGTGDYRQHAHCINGEWLVSSALVQCPDNGPDILDDIKHDGGIILEKGEEWADAILDDMEAIWKFGSSKFMSKLN